MFGLEGQDRWENETKVDPPQSVPTCFQRRFQQEKKNGQEAN